METSTPLVRHDYRSPSSPGKQAPQADMPATNSTPPKDADISRGTRLKLPPEVIGRIFWHMDEATFFIALQVCRQFWQAGSTRKNLLHQVRRLPGLRPGLEDLRGDQLRTLCRVRAVRSTCMAWVLADIRICKLPSGTMVSTSAFSSKMNANRFNCLEQCCLALANEDGTITLYSLANDDVRPILTLDLNIIGDRENAAKIAALAFSPRGDLTVLYEQGDYFCDKKHKGNCHHNTKKAEFESSCLGYRVYQLLNLYDLTNEDTTSANYQICQNQLSAKRSAIPVGLASLSSEKASIAWKSRKGKSGCQVNIQLIRARDGRNGFVDCEFDPSTVMSIDDGKVMPMTFVEGGSRLLIRNAMDPVHQCSRRYFSSNDDSPCHSNISHVEWHGHDDCPDIFNIGVPFHGTHTYLAEAKTQGESMCVLSHLALGSPSETVCESQIDGKYIHYLYILQRSLTISSGSCNHFLDSNRDHLLVPWTPVALLAGWRQNRGTMGSIIDITPRHNRIASAAWNRVLVWTFDPDCLYADELDVYFPPRDYSYQKGIGRLRPILLPSQGIVHALKWIDDDTLFGLTDRGLVKWYIGPLASGKREFD